jgi:hypothetical protein
MPHRNAHRRIVHHRILAWVALFLLGLGLGAPLAAGASGPGAVVLSLADDPYKSLAQEIADAEQLPLANTFAEALANDPETILWVAAPGSLSEEAFAQWSLALKAHGRAVAMGLISGGTMESARALWQRRPAQGGRCVVAVPREDAVETYVDGQLVDQVPLSKEALVAALSGAAIVSYQGHGSRSGWHILEEVHFRAEDVPDLPPLVAIAGSCQTLQVWGENSIAMRMVDRGAVAYVGFLHSPIGYTIGEPKDFPWRYTWPDYPIGHLIQVQARGLTQGHIGWPYWMMLGDPRNALAQEAPYQVLSDEERGDERIIKLAGLPAGVAPVRIEDGAAYRYVRVPGVGRAYRGDPFYDGDLQMADIGAHKYLLVRSDGGELEVRLWRRTPFWWPPIDALLGSLDQSTLFHHIEGDFVMGLALAGLAVLLVALRLWRRPDARGKHWVPALSAGLGLTLFRTLYALARRGYLTTMFVGYLRTIDVQWEISPILLAAMGITCIGGVWLWLGARHWWGRVLWTILLLAPTSLMVPLWLGVNVLLNTAAVRTYGGLPIYGYGMAATTFIAALLEAAVVLLFGNLGSLLQRRKGC